MTSADRYEAACRAAAARHAPLVDALVARGADRSDLTLEQTGGMVFVLQLRCPVPPDQPHGRDAAYYVWANPDEGEHAIVAWYGRWDDWGEQAALGGSGTEALADAVMALAVDRGGYRPRG